MGYSSIPPGILTLFVLLSIWALIWKGIALWKAARNNSKPWFVALLIVNTVGILEIIYIFFLSDKKANKPVV
ncbi:MAG: hypothetical protein A2599_03260 [Candidatus Staskawiczbacteria bacterium RIFOXYD1_FULL_39_28]|uniref:DUF5652 domain-containing protein n=1 Tax=Candidatus Staskawiczbacteria bacterium RIFOXYC1_FULL_38_18 TaxID=1802229 RepID=A0A1G2JD28_9BACT|nr:MAG: hypothetical protein A2401_03415 [Candidatus Staskawiczbacteria bacterium RIFOXYC1_FULL_38_18]OGZ90336.1 MAG: hypothetical protein A2599_03260 [Candidatus Staskawiczbacteria bacterium RIFOXYD1_FULL_39_28]